MNEKERLEIIKNAVANPVEVAPQFEGLLEELKAEELVLEHGIKHALKPTVNAQTIVFLAPNAQGAVDSVFLRP